MVIELSGVQFWSEIILVISNRTRAARSFDFEITSMICNGNRTEWSPIRSVIIRVINKIGRPRNGSPIC